MGLHNFRGLGGEKSLVYRDLQMGRSTVKKLSPYFALLFKNMFCLFGFWFALTPPPPPPPPTRAARSRFKRSIKKKRYQQDEVLLKQHSTGG